jgi:hypothetical protein
MPPNTKVDFIDAHQDRSKKTLDDLLQAAYNIVEDADPNVFNSRNLADKAGYALGTINKRLGAVENVFLWAIEKGREHKLQDLIDLITELDPRTTLQEFSEAVVDIVFRNIGTVGPKVMRYYENKMIKRLGSSSESMDLSDVFIEPYLAMVNANQSNTFRKMSTDETRLVMKSMQALIERPFINNDPIAGSDEHRQIAVKSLIRLWGK